MKVPVVSPDRDGNDQTMPAVIFTRNIATRILDDKDYYHLFFKSCWISFVIDLILSTFLPILSLYQQTYRAIIQNDFSYR